MKNEDSSSNGLKEAKLHVSEMLNMDTLEELCEQKFIRKQTHPILPLTIYNYSQKAQIERKWTPETMASRGLILDNEGMVVARPFPKFFNYTEHLQLGYTLPNLPYQIYEKMDGSLGIVTVYKGSLTVATRGSFTSDQSMEARQMLAKKYAHKVSQPYTEVFIEGYTYLFEIITPRTRVVCDYGKRRELVLLGIIENETGQEAPMDMLDMAFPRVPSFGFKTPLSEIAEKHAADNAEGFVVHYDDGTRVKIKFSEYVRLHKIITYLSTKSIWESLSRYQSLPKNLPEESQKWVDSTAKQFKETFVNRYHEIHERFNAYYDETRDRKKFADRIKDDPDRAMLFTLLDMRPIDVLLWKSLKPQKFEPFTLEGDE